MNVIKTGIRCGEGSKWCNDMVLYHVSAGFKALEKNARGHHCSLMYCYSTAPTATPEALVMTLVGALGTAWVAEEGVGEGIFGIVKCCDGIVSPCGRVGWTFRSETPKWLLETLIMIPCSFKDVLQGMSWL